MHNTIELVGFTSYLLTFQYAVPYLGREILFLFLVCGFFFFTCFKTSDVGQSKGEEIVCKTSTSREVDNSHYCPPLLPSNYWKKILSH